MSHRSSFSRTAMVGLETHVEIAGELDLDGRDELLELFEPLVRPGVRLTVDASGVDFIDSAGLSCLVLLSQAVADADGTLTVLPSAFLRRVAARTFADEILGFPPVERAG